MGSIRFSSFVVSPFQTNCYVLWDADTSSAAIIDPGGGSDRIAAYVSSHDLRVEWILLTHGHLDHTYCAGELAALYGARIGMHEADLPLLSDTLGIGEVFFDMARYVGFEPTDYFVDSQVFSLGNSEIEVACTPGHSEGGLCYVTDAGVFCGDTVFAGSVGRSDLLGGSHGQLIESIKSRLLAFGDSTPLYPGHGPATTVGVERATNPYLG